MDIISFDCQGDIPFNWNNWYISLENANQKKENEKKQKYNSGKNGLKSTPVTNTVWLMALHNDYY